MNKKQEFECEFCFKTFVKESSLIAHSCAKKMRWLDKDNKNVIMGFTAWKRFYQLTQTNRKNKTYKDFVDSQYYNDFVNFGRWAVDSDIVKPYSYIDYLIKSNIKLKDWTKNSIYDVYLRDMTLKEDPTEALERSIEWLQKWSEVTGNPIEEFHKKISSNKLVDLLRAGRISPWLLFISTELNTFYEKFDNSQVKLLETLLDTKVWSYKLKKHQKEIKEYGDLIRSLGL